MSEVVIALTGIGTAALIAGYLLAVVTDPTLPEEDPIRDEWTHSNTKGDFIRLGKVAVYIVLANFYGLWTFIYGIVLYLLLEATYFYVRRRI